MVMGDCCNTNTIRPFRFWCQKVLPAVYDDSLSYYESLCKLYKLINEDRKAINNSFDAILEINGLLDKWLDGGSEDYPGQYAVLIGGRILGQS